MKNTRGGEDSHVTRKTENWKDRPREMYLQKVRVIHEGKKFIKYHSWVCHFSGHCYYLKHSWPLNDRNLNCMGPLTLEFFQLTLGLLHNPQLSESVDPNSWIWGPTMGLKHPWILIPMESNPCRQWMGQGGATFSPPKQWLKQSKELSWFLLYNQR